jgi:GMP synthase (glutamine-hydrolysing)
MYIYVTVTESESYYNTGPAGTVKPRLEQASGERCLVVPYREMNMKVVAELSPRAIAMSGFGGHFHSRRIEWFYGMDDVLHGADLPIIGLCGSHQLMGFCFNGDIRRLKELRDEPMRKLRKNEHWPRRPCGDPKYDLSPYLVADGYLPIRRVKNDPLFAGLPRTMIMRCSHYCEVKKLPRGFELLATSDHCRIEAMRHRTRSLYGTQFHPEAYAAPFFHGRKLLENFARIVDEFWKVRC